MTIDITFWCPMELNDIGGIIGTVRSVVGLAREVFDSLPSGEKKKALKDSIESAERKMQEYNAEIAVKLGYQLCRSHFPPVIILEDVKKHFLFHCPDCGKEVNTAPASVGSEPVARSRWMQR
jgi:hypothetical protein